MMMRGLIASGMVALTLFMAPSASAEAHRSAAVLHEFQRLHPCPSTGKRYGGCPGYIKDHRVALCVGGADAVYNLQWQTVAQARAKDRVECKKGKGPITP